MLTNLIIQVKN